MTDVLAQICADKREHVTLRKAEISEAEMIRRAEEAPGPRGFAAALTTASAAGYGLIAEIKRASPSKGVIREDFDPPAIARAYAEAGAACLSVLTDIPWFQGHNAYLRAARAVVDLPVLRKDFMVDPWQVLESRAIGADAILLIMAAIDDTLAGELHAAARQWGMDVLIEVHDAAELDRALALPDGLIGINNRNLKTLGVDLATTEELAPRVPAGRDIVGESGLGAPDDLARLARLGVRRFLVGESLMRQPDIAAATRALLADPVPAP